MSSPLFAEFLDTRLHILDGTDDETPVGLLTLADYLEAEADLVAHAADKPWHVVDDPRRAAYLASVHPIARDPIAARMLALADQVVAAFIRGHLGEVYG